MEISPPKVNIPHPGHFLEVSAYWRRCLSQLFAFPQEYRAIFVADVFESDFQQCLDFFGFVGYSEAR
jgi:hypothetical protein